MSVIVKRNSLQTSWLASQQEEAPGLSEELNEIAKHCAELPVLDKRSADEILYNKNGLPLRLSVVLESRYGQDGVRDFDFFYTPVNQYDISSFKGKMNSETLVVTT